MINVSEETKRALKNGAHKDIIVTFPNGEHEALNNESLVAETFAFEEHTCSSDTLKFGLCEGAKVTFQAVDIGDIYGLDIKVDVKVNNELVPLGFFTVDSCISKAVGSRMFYKVTAYNKLLSEALDANISASIKALTKTGEDTEGKTSIFYILDRTLGDYAITKSEDVSNPIPQYVWYDTNRSLHKCYSDGTTLSTYTVFGLARVILSDSCFTSDVYYRIKFNPIKIREYIKDKFKDVLKNGNDDWLFLWTSTGQQYVYYKYTIDQVLDAGSVWGFNQYGEKITVESKKIGYETDAFGMYETSEQYTPWIRDVRDITIRLPMLIEDYEYDEWPPNGAYRAEQNLLELLNLHPDWLEIQELTPSGIETRKITAEEAEGLSNPSLREMQSAVYEANCQYGKLDRITDLFYGSELNQGGLLPADTLYPSDSLYPAGADESIYAGDYTNLLVGKPNKFKYLIVTYKTTETDSDGNVTEVEKTLQRTVNTDGNVNYNMSDNWLLLNLVWTAEEVGAFADAMVEKMQAIEWVPFDLDSKALPYIESGDMIEITSGDTTYNTYILERNMKGIQHMQDSYFNGSVETF